jgi:DNA-binding NtrC family response regulator
MHLIIADSDDGFLEACERYASLQGVTLRTAKGGLECLDELRRSPPDVLALDMELPWGGGDGVLSVMRDDELLASIPVVLLDLNSKIGAGPGRFPPNVVGRLIKPLDVATLFDCVYSAADCRDIFPRRPIVEREPAGLATRRASAHQEFARG